MIQYDWCVAACSSLVLWWSFECGNAQPLLPKSRGIPKIGPHAEQVARVAALSRTDAPRKSIWHAGSPESLLNRSVQSRLQACWLISLFLPFYVTISIIIQDWLECFSALDRSIVVDGWAPKWRTSINPLECKCNYSDSSNNMKLVHWPLMRELLHIVQRWGNWMGLQPA